VFPQTGDGSKLRDPQEPLPSLLALLGLDASSTDDPAPPAGRKEFYFLPVSVTVYCLMFLVVETLIFHTCHLIARSVDDFSGKNPHSIATEVLATAERSPPFVPAVCLLFVANRMYVLASSQGKAEPQIWVKACVILATIGVAIQPFLVFGLALGTERSQSLTFSDLAGSEFDVHPRSGLLKFIGKFAQSSFKNVQVVSLLCVYGGITGIMLSVLFFGRGLEPVSSAVLSAMLLAILYCGVEFVAWVVDAHAVPLGKQSAASSVRLTVRKAFGQLMTQAQPPRQKGAPDQSVQVAGDGEIHGNAPRTPCQDALEAASQTVQRAPMFAVLLLAARQRQLLLSPPDGQPSPLQSTCFLLTIIAMFLEVLASAYLATAIQEPGDAEKATSTDTTPIKSSRLTTALHVVQFILATISYGAALVVACCICPPVGPELAVPLSATMRCSLSLGAIFFFVHFVIGANKVSGAMLKKQSPKLQESLMAAHFGVSFCPLLCMLFLGCRMRALQISGNKGDPQWWAQDFMFVCVLATLVDCLCVSALPLFIGAVTKVDHKGRAKNEDRYLFGIYILTVIRYIALLSLHISITMICMSILTITPESSKEPRPEGSIIWVVATSIMWVTLAFLAASVLSSASVIGIFVKLAIESVDRLFLDCDVSVESALVNIGGGYVNIKGLVCSNPLSGGPFVSKYLLKADLIVVKVDIKKLVKSFGKSVDILELFVQGIEVVFEKGSDGHSSNVSALLDFLKVNEATHQTQTQRNLTQTRSRLLKSPILPVQSRRQLIRKKVLRRMMWNSPSQKCRKQRHQRLR